jgi:hypothetical protein
MPVVHLFRSSTADMEYAIIKEELTCIMEQKRCNKATDRKSNVHTAKKRLVFVPTTSCRLCA